jgi:hypothetical protein
VDISIIHMRINVKVKVRWGDGITRVEDGEGSYENQGNLLVGTGRRYFVLILGIQWFNGLSAEANK